MKVLIIEDEEIVAKVLVKSIKKIDDSIEVITILPSLKTALNWFAVNEEPDILFMDIQLSDGVSFDLLEKYKLSCPIIFTTAYDEYAIRAFKANGVDYLLKPVEEDDLGRAIDKCKEIIKNKAGSSIDIMALLQNMGQIQGQNSKYKQRFIVNVKNDWKPISVKDIAIFNKEVLNCIYLFNGERYLLNMETLDEVEQSIDPNQFYRANRQFIVNIDAINTVKVVQNSKLLVTLNAPNHKFEIELSREKAPVFKKWISK